MPTPLTGGAAMADLRNVIGLLYRADWTRHSLSAAAVMPGMSGYAVRTAADVVRRTAGAVSATRSFLDDLRGGSRPPRSG